MLHGLDLDWKRWTTAVTIDFMKAEAEAIRSGEHLYAQTIQTFRYLQERAARGDVALPENARQVSSFGQVARHRETAE